MNYVSRDDLDDVVQLCVKYFLGAGRMQGRQKVTLKPRGSRCMLRLPVAEMEATVENSAKA